MSNLNKDSQPNDYNAEPVLYCRHCLSLKVLNVPCIDNSDYCDNCSSTDIAECSIEEWEELYKARYGHKYIEQY